MAESRAHLRVVEKSINSGEVDAAQLVRYFFIRSLFRAQNGHDYQFIDYLGEHCSSGNIGSMLLEV